MRTNVKIIATLIARPGQAEALRVLLDGMVAATRSEPGNLRYDLWRDRADPGCFVLDELYVDTAAVEAHRATPHFQDYLRQIGELAERTARVLDPVA